MTNGDDNAVVHYGRRADGRLERVSTTPTQGQGSGGLAIPVLSALDPDPLFSQDALRLTDDHQFLMGVNTVDATVTVFRVLSDGELAITDVQDTGGLFPNAIAVYEDLVYVVNTGDFRQQILPVLTGFRLTDDGELEPIPDSAIGIGAPTGVSFPGHALFTKDGQHLVVSDIIESRLAVFTVDASGLLQGPTLTASEGINPFGMALAGTDVVLVSEAQANVSGASTVSSYRLDGTALTTISASVPTTQAAACWLSITPDERYVFSSNTFDGGSVSTFELLPTGELVLRVPAGARRPVNPQFGTTGPLDSVVTPDGKYFYQHFSTLGIVGAYRINANGTLTAIKKGDGDGLPLVGSQGLDGF